MSTQPMERVTAVRSPSSQYLTPAQINALSLLAEGDLLLHPRQYWALANEPSRHETAPGIEPTPQRYIIDRIIKILISRHLAQRVGKAAVRITEQGQQALDPASPLNPASRKRGTREPKPPPLTRGAPKKPDGAGVKLFRIRNEKTFLTFSTVKAAKDQALRIQAHHYREHPAKPIPDVTIEKITTKALSQANLVEAFCHGLDRLVLKVEKIRMKPLTKLAVYDRYL